MDDPVGFATALVMSFLGTAIISLAACIAGGVLVAPAPWMASPSVQGIAIGVGVLCIGWHFYWFMKLAKRNND
jgi:hypothetical protein